MLVAEDNPINQMLAMRLLEKRGIDVRLVTNGRQAVDALTRDRFDLVLMDCQMPELDGYEATQEIRRAEERAAAHPDRGHDRSIDTGDHEATKRVAHFLKGSAATMGAGRMAALCRELESAPPAHTADLLGALGTAFTEAVAALETKGSRAER